jgi:peptidyl-dipeptidase Dcp
MVEYTGSALLDLELHREVQPEALDLARFEGELLDRIGMPREIGLRHRPAHFQHLFAGGGYAAGYYAYLWAEVLEAEVLQRLSRPAMSSIRRWRRV